MEAPKTEEVQGMLQHYLNTTRPSSDDSNSPTTDSMDREPHSGYTASEVWTEDSLDEPIEFFREKGLALAAEHGHVFEAYHDDVYGRGRWVRCLWKYVLPMNLLLGIGNLRASKSLTKNGQHSRNRKV